VGLIYQIMTDLNFNAQYRYIGDRARQSGDDREELEGYGLCDITLSKENFLVDGITVRAGVKNLFDEKVVYPSFLVKAPEGNTRPAYGDDYPQTGREFVIQLSWQL
jgi:iron complex outermembrane receptor protein